MSDIGSDHSRSRCDCVTQIGYLEEIMINILARLSVKNVVACKCVAKHWLRLISEPQFPALQLSLSERKPKYIICLFPKYNEPFTHLTLMEENGNTSPNIPLPDFGNFSFPEMVCFLNGLICRVDTYEDEDDNDLIDVHIHIFNPITRDFLLLPRGSPSHVIPSVGLAFDPKTNDFKAFRFFSDSDEKKYKCEVYTSSSGEWRMISEGVEHPKAKSCISNIPRYVSIAGKMYWFVYSKRQPAKVDHILSVDMKDNFTKIELPTVVHELNYLIELEGCLSVVHLTYPDMHRKRYVEIYKLSNEGWWLRVRAELDMRNIVSLESVAARGNEILFIIRVSVLDDICYLIFDLKDGTWVTLLGLEDSFAEYVPVAFPFAESLLKCT